MATFSSKEEELESRIINLENIINDMTKVKDINDTRYEVDFLMAHSDYVNERLAEMQKKGWIIAGDIIIKNRDGHCTNHYFHIPLKRKI